MRAGFLGSRRQMHRRDRAAADLALEVEIAAVLANRRESEHHAEAGAALARREEEFFPRRARLSGFIPLPVSRTAMLASSPAAETSTSTDPWRGVASNALATRSSSASFKRRGSPREATAPPLEAMGARS